MAKHIILMSIDALRYDCNGYQPDKRELTKYDLLTHLETGTLDRISEKSLCFTQCISTNTYTTASHASIFTGLYPPRHGVRGFYDTKLHRDVYTLAEVLKIFGYTTVFFTDAPVVFLPLDLPRGFDHVFVYNEPSLMKFLEENKDNKILLFVHLFDVHEPYLLTKNSSYDNGDYHSTIEMLHKRFNIEPAPQWNEWDKWNVFVEKAGRDTELLFPLYVKGVSKFDRTRFRFFIESLEKFGLFEGGLLAIFSDHGEGKMYDADDSRKLFGDNRDRSRWFGHGGALFDNVIRVPLIICHKDLRPGVSDRLVSLADIFPSILRMATGKEESELLPYRLDGTDLFGESPRNETYSEMWNGNMGLDQSWERFSFLMWHRALRTNKEKFILYGEPEVLSGDYLKNLSDADFLKTLYRKVSVSFENYDGFMTNLHMLKAGVTTRSDLLSRFHRNDFKMYDLEKDHFEDSPLWKDTIDPALSSRFKTRLFDLCTPSVEAEKIFPPLGRKIIQNIAERILIDQVSETLNPVCDSKNLFNELLKKFYEDNKDLADAEFFRKCSRIFLDADAEGITSDVMESVKAGLSRKAIFDSYFMKRLFSHANATQEKTDGTVKSTLEKNKAPEALPELQEKIKEKEEAISRLTRKLNDAWLALDEGKKRLEEKDDTISKLNLNLNDAWKALHLIRNSRTWKLGQLYGRLFGGEAKWRANWKIRISGKVKETFVGSGRRK